MNKALFRVLPAAAMLFIVGCSKTPEPAVPEPVARVVTTPAERGDLPITVNGFGTVEFDPARQQVLATQIEARVTDILVQPGTRVEQGTVLVRLTPSSASGLDLSRARTDANAAEAELQRQKRLRDDGLSSDADVERAQLAARDLAAQVGTLNQNAGAIREVRAPREGIVDTIMVSAGDVVASGSPLVRVSAPDAILTRINLELEDATRLSPGDPVHLEGLDGGSQIADATIATIDLRVDPQTRMTAILVPVPPGNGFLPGEAVRAAAVAEIRKNALLVPLKSIFTDEQGAFVFVDVNGAAARRRVKTGASGSELVEIISGLSDGDHVVTEGGAILSDGMKLDTSPAAQAPSGDGK